MRVHLDVGICQGHNGCHAPAARVIDDLGRVVLLVEGDVPPALERQARLAPNCPDDAITNTENA